MRPLTNRGLTLIEMIIVTNILALVIIISISTYRAVMNRWQNQEEGIDNLYAASLFLELITCDLHSTFLPLGFQEITFIGRPSWLEFTTSSNNKDLLNEETRSDLVRIRYFLEDGELKVARSNQEPLTLASNIKGVTFSYYNGYTYDEVWDQEELPKGVRIEIELDDKRRLLTTAWIPTSRL